MAHATVYCVPACVPFSLCFKQTVKNIPKYLEEIPSLWPAKLLSLSLSGWGHYFEGLLHTILQWFLKSLKNSKGTLTQEFPFPTPELISSPWLCQYNLPPTFIILAWKIIKITDEKNLIWKQIIYPFNIYYSLQCIILWTILLMVPQIKCTQIL